MDRNEYSIIDIAKAFDIADHRLLLKKLGNIGVRGAVSDWFQNYLSNRHQYVSCNGFSSTMKLIRFGVPQGSILGPLLFLIFINDLHVPRAASLLHFLLLADDTNIFASHKSYDVLMDIMNHELNLQATKLFIVTVATNGGGG